MVEQEVPFRSKKPDILTEQFNKSVHPYTMMFLFQSYEQGAYRYLTELQREIFDRYYTDDLTIEGQYDSVGRQNLQKIIFSAFNQIRANISDELNLTFRPEMTPKFKIQDRSFISKEEKIILQKAKMSLTRKGRIVPQKTKDKMSAAMIRWLEKPENRINISIRQKGRTFSQQHREKLREAKRKDWNDDEKRKKMLKALEEGRKKARERKLAERAKQQGQE